MVFFNGNEKEIVNSYKYPWIHFNDKVVLQILLARNMPSKAKGKILDLMKTMWSLGSLNTTVFFSTF